MSNPESFARIPCNTLIKQLDFIKERINTVCYANSIKNLIREYDVYVSKCKKSWYNWFKPVVPKTFNGWISEIYNDYKKEIKQNIWCSNTIFGKCEDNDNYLCTRSTLRMLANNSDTYALICDQHLSNLTNVYNKCLNFDEARILVEQMFSDYPSLKTALKRE